MKNSDLSDAVSKFKFGFFVKYLKNEETIIGKKHPSAFKGYDKELIILSGWLPGSKK